MYDLREADVTSVRPRSDSRDPSRVLNIATLE